MKRSMHVIEIHRKEKRNLLESRSHEIAAGNNFSALVPEQPTLTVPNPWAAMSLRPSTRATAHGRLTSLTLDRLTGRRRPLETGALSRTPLRSRPVRPFARSPVDGPVDQMGCASRAMISPARSPAEVVLGSSRGRFSAVRFACAGVGLGRMACSQEPGICEAVLSCVERRCQVADCP